MNMEFYNSVFLIYWSLLECKFSLSVLNIWNRWKHTLLNKFSSMISIYNHLSSRSTNRISSQRSFLNMKIWDQMLNTYSPICFLFEWFGFQKYEDVGKSRRNKIVDIREERSKENLLVSVIKSMSKESNKIKKMNRKLAWIEATLNDLRVWKKSFSHFPFSSERKDRLDEELSVSKSIELTVPTIAYESISLVPRSITRTLSRFKAELIGQSSSLVLHEFQLAKYKALASLRYIGLLLLLPFFISLISKKWVLEPRIKDWWNTSQFQIFINHLQEHKALKRLQEVEELLWLDRVIMDYTEDHSQDLSTKFREKTVELAAIYNENSIQIILHLLTDIISFATLSLLVIIGQKRIAVSNPWVQELVHSLSDTMKAFSILLLTDLCIGFHSPHGWEIIIGSILEYIGFAYNKYTISCFVSTFPVILDTVFKYWIFRHLNRISPSIVATYHTMNE
uniref:Envelope membrane protein n=1 Tax=Tmesipteris elongata TaxID=50272 RepID=A0A059U6G4_TMEEL|nr:envelope membrane protein [Tmesipteris elongata]